MAFLRSVLFLWPLWLGGFCSIVLPSFNANAQKKAQSEKSISFEFQQAHNAVNHALAQRKEEAKKQNALKEARDVKAAYVETLKLNSASENVLRNALRETLVLDEELALQRAQRIAIDGRLARAGARLLRLYDVLLLKQKQVITSKNSVVIQKQKALKNYRLLVMRRAGLRKILAPNSNLIANAKSNLEGAVQIQAEDDVETLLEKADLARDLEDRYFRRAEAVRRRIMELEQERILARDVLGLARTQGLFDENDRRLQATRSGNGTLERSLPGSSVLGAASLASADSTGAGQERAAGGQVNDATESMGGADSSASSPSPPDAAPDLASGEAMASDNSEVSSDGFSGRDEPAALPSVDVITLPQIEVENAFAQLQTQESQLEHLLSQDELTLQQLKALEKLLKAHGAQMKAQSLSLTQKAVEQAREK